MLDKSKRQADVQGSAGVVVHLPQPLNRWARANPMERADLFRVYELGGAVHALAMLKDEPTISEFFTAYVSAQTALEALLGADPQAKVDLCLPAARELQMSVALIEREFFVDAQGNFAYPADPTVKIQSWRLWGLRRAVQSFEAVFRAEMNAAATYWVPKRAAFSTRDLVDSFDRSFLPDLHSEIGDIALAEYRSAGRCYAFGLWSAAGYHACRAVEAVLRSYFRAYTGMDDTDLKMWGELIGGLKDRKTPPVPVEKTIFYLQQLKDNERNPLMHVRVVLDEQDADILLNSSKIVIVMMAREMIALKQEKAATPLLQVIAGVGAAS